VKVKKGEMIVELLLESELESTLWSALEKQFGLIGSTLYHYLVLRSMVENVQKGRGASNKDTSIPTHLTQFLLNEWGLKSGEVARFQGVEFTIFSYGYTGIHRIVGDWHVQYTYRYARGQFEQSIEKEWKGFVQEAKKKVQKWSKQPFHELALKKTYLEKINKAYEVGNLYDSILIEDLHTDYEQAPLRLELQYERLLHPYFLRHQDVSLVDEKAIEEYVARHLEDVEAGLRLIGSQIVLERGRIDLLARDTNGVHVIIEVKVATDTDLVWQQSYYMKEIQKMYGGEVRFMVIAPKWEPHIMEMLLKSPNTEIYLFTPDIKQKEIRSIDFHKRVAS
jgi:hypothetical protein